MPGKRPLPCPSGFARNDSHAAELLKILGPQKLAALQKVFGGQRIWVPKKGQSMLCGTCRKRDCCIRLWRGKGYSVSKISESLALSPKSVYRILEAEHG
jgi:hypothetical protein